MDIGLGLTGRERVGQAALGRDGKRVADAGVVGREAHDAAEQGAVGAVAVVGLGERAVQGEIHLFKRRRDHLVRQIRDNAAPAVWELEGPIIFGPSTSKTLIKDIGDSPY